MDESDRSSYAANGSPFLISPSRTTTSSPRSTSFTTRWTIAPTAPTSPIWNASVNQSPRAVSMELTTFLSGGRALGVAPTTTHDRRRRTMHDQRRTTRDGRRVTDDGRRTTGDGRRASDNRGWATGDRRL